MWFSSRVWIFFPLLQNWQPVDPLLVVRIFMSVLWVLAFFLRNPCTGVGHNIWTPEPPLPQNKVELWGHRFFEVSIYYAHFFSFQLCFWGRGGVHILWPTPVQGFGKKTLKPIAQTKICEPQKVD